ncbi:helix-turn-helix transcriptional regulator [Hallella absiana]|uniref:helix-turn-helix transcriptional regulator n=1 Tax=Hallella absiana TaxID=2925336 RepID=UPI0021C64058|nr:WYL domain-containing protein [Hallella absiana]
MHYDRLNEFTAITQQGMKCIEHELCKGPKSTVQLQDALEECGVGNSERTVQDLIKKLNDVYGSDNHISRGSQSNPHKIDDSYSNLAFPELVVNADDRMVIHKILKLAVFFDGAIPMKEIFKASGLMRNGIDEIFDEIRKNADVSIESNEAKLMADLYYAIDKKQVVSFPYKPLSNVYYGEEIHVSPYYLKRYNNKWFLIGHVENMPQKGIGHNYPWSVFPLQRILTEGGTFFRPGKSSRNYKEIDRNRIKEYYKNVIGFYVPVEKNAPFVEELHPERIIIQAKDDITFRLIKENPIHTSQTPYPMDRRFTIMAIESPSLYSKLLSYGGKIEVLQPEKVRTELKRQLCEALKIYE